MSDREATEHQGLENRLEGPIDGALHLLDRQLLDSEGKMLGKIDDVELADDDGTLVITGLLTGPAALLSRLGGGAGKHLTRKWVELKVSDPTRGQPPRIDYADIDRLDSALHLSARRDGVLRRGRKAHRLGQLTGMDVHTPDGKRVGRVLDARFEPDGDGRQTLTSLIVGHGRPGSLLGYDRGRAHQQGPWLISKIVRRLHRHTGLVDVGDVDILWGENRVEIASEPRSAEMQQ
jgi:sporulation protein YlmC with PRC-barrel domain